jgi:UDP-glucuronate 4-epimerase
MKCLVTGAAGFIGSHLCERLLQAGHSVVGLDAFIPYYPRALKEANLRVVREHSSFRFHELDLRRDSLENVLQGIEIIYHLAAMAGLVKSWTEFDLYRDAAAGRGRSRSLHFEAVHLRLYVLGLWPIQLRR